MLGFLKSKRTMPLEKREEPKHEEKSVAKERCRFSRLTCPFCAYCWWQASDLRNDIVISEEGEVVVSAMASPSSNLVEIKVLRATAPSNVILEWVHQCEGLKKC